MGRGGIEPSTVLVSLRTADDLNEVTKEWAAVGTDELTLAAPWRTFRWCLGRHYGGTYWSSTLRGPVICESRLELAGLLFADFEPSVRHIVAQPFFLRATVDQKVCKHVPDHLLITDEALSLWMSSLSVAMADPKVAFTLEWTRQVVEARGWRYEVATEPSAVELGNVRFLSARGGAQKISHPFAGSERHWDPYWLQVRRGKTDYNTEETKWGSVR